MFLKDYTTKTEVIHRPNRGVPDVWTIGIDYGFSGVKGISANKAFCFPNCAIQVSSFEGMMDSSEKDILLKDKDGFWIIGEKAHEAISPTNAMNYESEMYERNRYFTPGFKALMKAGLAIGLSSNQFRRYQNEPILVQTGLPPEYKNKDTEMIRETLSGDYEFEMRAGKGPFQRYKFTVKPSNVFVMSQPQGALFSTIKTNDGFTTEDGMDILKSNTLVLDPGFKTLDIFDISAGMYKDSNTFDTLGMHEIFRRTVEEANRVYGANITVSGMQKALRRGYITTFNRAQLRRTKLTAEFEALLKKYTDEVYEEALQKIFSIYDYLQEHDYMIVTGGTGDAWAPALEERFRDMDGLRILRANRNDMTLSNVYSNVRGYYLYLVDMAGGRVRR